MTNYLTPLSLFRQGKDTQAIARHLRKSEAWVYAAIHRERCLEKGDTAHEDHKEKRRAAEKQERETKRKAYLKSRNRSEEYVRLERKGMKPLIKAAGDSSRRTWVQA